MQIFPRELNYLPLALAVVAGGLGAGVFILFWVYFTPPNLQVGYTPKQPVDYSHRLHAGELGMDCRYCHSQVERSHEAMVPPTQTCMGCHAPQGTGNGPAGWPSLKGQHPDYIVAQLKAFKQGIRANDTGRMMRNVSARMSDMEMKLVAAYIAGIR